MKFVEKVAAPVGHLLVNVFRHGRLIERFEGENLIVAGSRPLLASLLGGVTANKSVAKIGFGSSGAAPQSGNTTLTDMFSKAHSAVEFPVAGVVRFDFMLGTGEANGLSIREFGLLTATDVLFSRRVRATPIPKDNSISFTGSWSITF